MMAMVGIDPAGGGSMTGSMTGMWLVFAATCFLAAVLVSVSAGFSGSPVTTAPVAVVLGAMGWRSLAGSNEAG